MTTTNTNIDYQHVHLNFNWTYIRDKQIVHKGDWKGGALLILDSEGRLVKGYGYDLIDIT